MCYPRVDQVGLMIAQIISTGGEVEKQQCCEAMILALRQFSTYTWMKAMGQVSRKDAA